LQPFAWATELEDSFATVQAFVLLDEDFALLLDTLVSRSLDFGVMLEEDSSSQSPQMDEDESSVSRGAKLLSSSPQAARNVKDRSAGIRNGRSFILFPPFGEKDIFFLLCLGCISVFWR
jgi:hypothetical protein